MADGEVARRLRYMLPTTAVVHHLTIASTAFADVSRSPSAYVPMILLEFGMLPAVDGLLC